MSRYLFSPSARNDLREIIAQVQTDRPAAAAKLLERIERKCAILADMPGIGAKRDDLHADLRCYRVPHSHYLIFYREVSEGIEIVRVLHGARDIGRFFEGE